MSAHIGIRDQLVKARRAKPFAPFQILMTNGERHRVMDRYSWAMNQDLVVVLPRTGASIRLQLHNIHSINVRGASKDR